MTTIYNFPQELLIEIFKKLKRNQLVEAQTVCRSWYYPAHVMLLKKVHLHGVASIESFIVHIDQNMSPYYLGAVEDIYIGGSKDFGVDYHFTTENIHQLISRFPNLKHVVIDSFSDYLGAFNDEVCQTIIENCPRLESFQVFLDVRDYSNADVYCDTMYKFRSLLTAMNLDLVGFASKFEGAEKFIASFPRLRGSN